MGREVDTKIWECYKASSHVKKAEYERFRKRALLLNPPRLQKHWTQRLRFLQMLQDVSKTTSRVWMAGLLRRQRATHGAPWRTPFGWVPISSRRAVQSWFHRFNYCTLQHCRLATLQPSSYNFQFNMWSLNQRWAAVYRGQVQHLHTELFLFSYIYNCSFQQWILKIQFFFSSSTFKHFTNVMCKSFFLTYTCRSPTGVHPKATP